MFIDLYIYLLLLCSSICDLFFNIPLYICRLWCMLIPFGLVYESIFDFLVGIPLFCICNSLQLHLNIGHFMGLFWFISIWLIPLYPALLSVSLLVLSLVRLFFLPLLLPASCLVNSTSSLFSVIFHPPWFLVFLLPMLQTGF